LARTADLVLGSVSSEVKSATNVSGGIEGVPAQTPTDSYPDLCLSHHPYVQDLSLPSCTQLTQEIVLQVRGMLLLQSQTCQSD
jgi:hypothetical protein